MGEFPFARGMVGRFVADPREEFCSIWEYRFEDPFDYESIKLVRSASYVIEDIETPPVALEAVVPHRTLDIIPRENDFQKVADFPLRIVSGIASAKQWAEAYCITARQANYYRQAAEAMGLLEGYHLTEVGRRYVGMKTQERADFLAEQLMKIPIINEAHRVIRRSGGRGVCKEEIASLIARRSHLSGTTLLPRASSILSYFRWVARNTGAVLVRKGRIYPRPTTLDEFWASSPDHR